MSSTTAPTLVKSVYCTACSVQTGKNKKSIHHENMVIEGKHIKPTYKTARNKADKAEKAEKSDRTDKSPESEEKKVIGYVAILDCPVSHRKISTFIDKSNALQLLASLKPLNPPNPLNPKAL